MSTTVASELGVELNSSGMLPTYSSAGRSTLPGDSCTALDEWMAFRDGTSPHASLPCINTSTNTDTDMRQHRHDTTRRDSERRT
jgi:hypothetical protein